MLVCLRFENGAYVIYFLFVEKDTGQVVTTRTCSIENHTLTLLPPI